MVSTVYMMECAQLSHVSAGKRYRRETSTMPQWAGSCWYYLRYLQPWNTERPVDPEVEKYWLPVDLYVGKHLSTKGSSQHAMQRLQHPLACLTSRGPTLAWMHSGTGDAKSRLLTNPLQTALSKLHVMGV